MGWVTTRSGLVCVLVMINYLWINHWQLSLFLYLILFIILDLFGPTNKELAGPNDAELIVGCSSQLPGSSLPLSIAIMWNGVQMIAPNTCQNRVQIILSRFIQQNMPMMGFKTLLQFYLSPHLGWVLFITFGRYIRRRLYFPILVIDGIITYLHIHRKQ